MIDLTLDDDDAPAPKRTRPTKSDEIQVCDLESDTEETGGSGKRKKKAVAAAAASTLSEKPTSAVW